jgi:hypothetical protein
MKASMQDAMIDCPAAHSEIDELCSGDDAVLPTRQRRDQLILVMRSGFSPYDGVNLDRVPHAAILPRSALPLTCPP